MYLSIIIGTNAGEAFGQAGIGVYGKRFFRRRGDLHVEFKYRTRAIEKVAKPIQLKVSVAVPSVIDDVIRRWLQVKHTLKRKTEMRCISTLFNRAIDADVQALSYVDFQNQRKIGKRPRQAISSNSPQPTSSAVMHKLQLARYREKKRKKRTQEKNAVQYQVHTHCLFVCSLFSASEEYNKYIC